jgi:hypothetical protein
MGQTSGRAGLAQESFAAFIVGNMRGQWKLDGHDAIQHAMPRLDHVSHPAAGYEAELLVAGNRRNVLGRRWAFAGPPGIRHSSIARLMTLGRFVVGWVKKLSG